MAKTVGLIIQKKNEKPPIKSGKIDKNEGSEDKK